MHQFLQFVVSLVQSNDYDQERKELRDRRSNVESLLCQTILQRLASGAEVPVQLPGGNINPGVHF